MKAQPLPEVQLKDEGVPVVSSGWDNFFFGSAQCKL